MNKTLIVYGTRKGTTTDSVHIIVEVLMAEYDHEVEICESVNLKFFKKRLGEFNNIIIGSSIVSGRWKSRVLSFAKKDIFEGKNVAVFVTAGGTLNKYSKKGLSKDEGIEEAIRKYIDKYAKKFKFTPISKTAFGGKVIRRGVLKFNSWDSSDITTWAKVVGEKLKVPILINN